MNARSLYFTFALLAAAALLSVRPGIAAQSGEPSGISFPEGLGITAPEDIVVTASTAAKPGPIPETLAEMDGYRLVLADDLNENALPLEGEYAPPVFFEVIPSADDGIYTELARAMASCSCLKADITGNPKSGRFIIRVARLHPPPGGDGFLLFVWLAHPEGIVLQRIIPNLAPPPRNRPPGFIGFGCRLLIDFVKNTSFPVPAR